LYKKNKISIFQIANALSYGKISLPGYLGSICFFSVVWAIDTTANSSARKAHRFGYREWQLHFKRPYQS
jgi:hypothetical protein